MKLLAFWDLWTKPRIQLSVLDEFLMWGSVMLLLIGIGILILLYLKIRDGLSKRRSGKRKNS